MNDNNESMKGPIFSAIIGAIFFAIPYLGLNVPIFISLPIGVVAFFASNMIFSDNKKTSVIDEMANQIKTSQESSVASTIKLAKEQNAKVYGMIDKVDNEVLKINIKEIYQTASKIIAAVEKNHAKADKANTFFNYYLPATLKILERYDEIENQNINSSESIGIMKSTEDMIIKINKSFKDQLSQLYQTEMIDTDAEIKVLENMLKSEGIESDFKLNK